MMMLEEQKCVPCGTVRGKTGTEARAATPPADAVQPKFLVALLRALSVWAC